jgi:hypothetical protein
MFSTEKRCKWICISDTQIGNIGTSSSGIETVSRGWHAGVSSCRLCSRLSVSVGLRCTLCFVFTAWLWVLRGANFGLQVSGHVVLMKHSQVFVYLRLHLLLRIKLHTTLHLFSVLSARCLDHIIHSFYCEAQNLCVAIFAIFKARCMSDCSSWTWPPCLAILTDIMRT